MTIIEEPTSDSKALADARLVTADEFGALALVDQQTYSANPVLPAELAQPDLGSDAC